MMPWWKRLVYSLISVLLGGSIVGIIVSFHDGLFNSHNNLDLTRLFISTAIVMVASLSGWFVAIPIVLLVRDYAGRRVWIWGTVGACIGPGVVLGFGLYGFITNPRVNGFFVGLPWFLMATAVSIVSTVSYLGLVLHRKAS